MAGTQRLGMKLTGTVGGACTRRSAFMEARIFSASSSSSWHAADRSARRQHGRREGADVPEAMVERGEELLSLTAIGFGTALHNGTNALRRDLWNNNRTLHGHCCAFMSRPLEAEVRGDELHKQRSLERHARMNANWSRAPRVVDRNVRAHAVPMGRADSAIEVARPA